MAAADLPERLIRFLQTTIPSFASAELLLFILAHRDQRYTPAEIVAAMKPTVVTLSEVKQGFLLFQEKKLVAGNSEIGFAYIAPPPQLQRALEDLADAYNERPVTLIRTIYALAEHKIQSFADSFKIKSE